MIHPLAVTGYPNGALGMRAGDRVVHTIDGRRGVADEFLPEGHAFVSWDDGAFETEPWRNLRPETASRNEEANMRYVVEWNEGVFGPFESDHEASEWALKHCAGWSWRLRPLREPGGRAE